MEWLKGNDAIRRTRDLASALESLVKTAPSEYATSLSDVDFPKRILSSLEWYEQIETVQELVEKTKAMSSEELIKWLSAFPNVGPLTSSRIHELIMQARRAPDCLIQLRNPEAPKAKRKTKPKT